MSITAIILGFVNGILVRIPIIGWLAVPILNLCMLILLILGIINSVNKQKKELPIIGKFAEKLTF